MSFRQGARGGGQGGRGRGGGGGGGYHKTPMDNRFRGTSTSSGGSGRSNEHKGTVAPLYVDPKWSRQEQLEFIRKERPAAKYNVLLPFRRSRAFCPRFYQQALYTPSLILVQELFALAEAACSRPSNDQLGTGGSGAAANGGI